MADQDYPTLYGEMEESAQRTRAAAIAFEHVLGGTETEMVPVNGYPNQPTIAGRVKARIDPLVDTLEAAAESVKRFAGVHPVAPTTRYDGSPLQPGDEYQNTTNHLRYSWENGVWAVLNGSVQALSAALGGPDGALMVGFGAGKVADVLGDVLGGQADLSNKTDPAKGAAIIGRGGQVVDSIAELRLLSKASVARHAFVTGYYAAGDGGGGPYYRDPSDTTSPETPGKVVVADDGARWKLQLTTPLSLLQCGVRGGTGEDQTARIQAVINDNPGQEIFAPGVSYRTDESLEIKAGTRIVMAKSATFRRYAAHSASTTPVVYLLDSHSECRGGTIKTENAAPTGAVVLGHKSATDNRNAWWWRFCDMDIEGNGSGYGWSIISGQVTYPMNANYFGTVHNVNTKAFDFGCTLFENANAHNISNVHFWLCKKANIWLRGAYANNFSNMFFHGGAADGCIGIQLVNRVLGPYTQSEQNKFNGFTVETGGLNDQAFDIDTLCTGNVLIGTSNVAGGYTIRNADNNIQLSGYGSASYVSLPGESALQTGVPAGVATPVTPSGYMSTGTSGAYEATVNVYSSANGSLCRVDKLLISARSSAFAPSVVVLIGSAFLATGVAGEPTSVVYDLDFTDGPSSPRLRANVTSVGGAGTFGIKTRLQRV